MALGHRQAGGMGRLIIWFRCMGGAGSRQRIYEQCSTTSVYVVFLSHALEVAEEEQGEAVVEGA